jgi:hypothetical protein
MPNLLRPRSKIDNCWRQFVMRVGENEDADHFRWSDGAMQNPNPILHRSNTPLLLAMLALASNCAL